MASDEVIQINGNAGGEPEQRDGSEWINFSVAVTKSYNDKITRWVRVGTKKPELVEWVKENIHKGTPVAVEGYMNEKTWNGKPQYEMIGFRIGVVSYPKFNTGGERKPVSGEGEGFNWG